MVSDHTVHIHANVGFCCRAAVCDRRFCPVVSMQHLQINAWGCGGFKCVRTFCSLVFYVYIMFVRVRVSVSVFSSTCLCSLFFLSWLPTLLVRVSTLSSIVQCLLLTSPFSPPRPRDYKRAWLCVLACAVTGIVVVSHPASVRLCFTLLQQLSWQSRQHGKPSPYVSFYNFNDMQKKIK